MANLNTSQIPTIHQEWNWRSHQSITRLINKSSTAANFGWKDNVLSIINSRILYPFYREKANGGYKKALGYYQGRLTAECFKNGDKERNNVDTYEQSHIQLETAMRHCGFLFFRH